MLSGSPLRTRSAHQIRSPLPKPLQSKYRAQPAILRSDSLPSKDVLAADVEFERWEQSLEERVDEVRNVTELEESAAYHSNFDLIMTIIDQDEKKVGEQRVEEIKKKRDRWLQTQRRAMRAPHSPAEHRQAMAKMALFEQSPAQMQEAIEELQRQLASRTKQLRKIEFEREELLFKIARLQAEVVILREKQSQFDQVELVRLKTEVAHYRLEREWLFGILVGLLPPGQHREDFRQLLRSRILSIPTLLEGIDVKDVHPLPPLEFLRPSEQVSRLFPEDADLGAGMAARTVTALLQQQEHAKDTRKAPEGRICIVFVEVMGLLAVWRWNPELCRRALLMFSAALRETLVACSGYEVRTEADAWMLSFGTAHDAVDFCIRIQYRVLEVEWPASLLQHPNTSVVRFPEGAVCWRGFRIRAAISIGRPFCERNPESHAMDYHGHLIPLTASLVSRAAAGTVVCTDGVYEEVKEVLSSFHGGAAAQFLGPTPVSGAAQPLLLYSLFPARLRNRPAQVLEPDVSSSLAIAAQPCERISSAWRPVLFDWEKKRGECQRAIEYVLETRHQLESISKIGTVAHMPAMDTGFFVLLQVDKSAILWDRAAPVMQQALLLVTKLLRQVAAAAGGYEAVAEPDFFCIVFADIVSALNFAMELQMQLVLLDWPEELDSWPETRAVESAESSTHWMWRGLRMRSSVVSGPAAALNGTGRRGNKAYDLGKAIIDATHGGQLTISSDVLEKLNPFLRNGMAEGGIMAEILGEKGEQKFVTSIIVSEFARLLVDPTLGTLAIAHHVTMGWLPGRFDRFRRSKNQHQVLLSEHWDQRVRGSQNRLHDIERVEAVTAERERSAKVTRPVSGNRFALVFTCVQGGLGLWDYNTLAMLEATRFYHEITRQLLAAHNGCEIAAVGDNFFLAFDDDHDAISFCLHLQQRLVEHPSWPVQLMQHPDAGEELNPGGRPIFRGLRVAMGVHSGYGFSEEDPATNRVVCYGSVVNKAARLSAAASGGQILISEDIQAKCRWPELYAEAFPQGEMLLRGDKEPTRVFQVISQTLEGRIFPLVPTVVSSPEQDLVNWWKDAEKEVVPAEMPEDRPAIEDSLLDKLSESDEDDDDGLLYTFQGHRDLSAVRYKDTLGYVIARLDRKRGKSERKGEAVQSEYKQFQQATAKTWRRDSWDPVVHQHKQRYMNHVAREQRLARLFRNCTLVLSKLRDHLDELIANALEAHDRELERKRVIQECIVGVQQTTPGPNAIDSDSSAEQTEDKPTIGVEQKHSARAPEHKTEHKERRRHRGRRLQQPGDHGHHWVDEAEHQLLVGQRDVLRELVRLQELDRMMLEDDPTVLYYYRLAHPNEEYNRQPLEGFSRQIRKRADRASRAEPGSGATKNDRKPQTNDLAKQMQATTYRLHRQVRAFFALLRTYLQSFESGEKFLTEEEFVYEWIKAWKRVKEEEDIESGEVDWKKRKQEKGRSARQIFKDQVVWCLDGEIEEQAAKDDWRKLTQSIIGSLAKFFNFVKQLMRRLGVKRGDTTGNWRKSASHTVNRVRESENAYERERQLRRSSGDRLEANVERSPAATSRRGSGDPFDASESVTAQVLIGSENLSIPDNLGNDLSARTQTNSAGKSRSSSVSGGSSASSPRTYKAPSSTTRSVNRFLRAPSAPITRSPVTPSTPGSSRNDAWSRRTTPNSPVGSRAAAARFANTRVNSNALLPRPSTASAEATTPPVANVAKTTSPDPSDDEGRGRRRSSRIAKGMAHRGSNLPQLARGQSIAKIPNLMRVSHIGS